MKNLSISVRIVLILCMLASCIKSFSGEYFHTVPKSPKPSVYNALRGVKGCTFSLLSNGVDVFPTQRLSFIDKYFEQEILKWLSVTCPDVRAGLNYSYPICANMDIKASYTHSGYRAYNGVYYWTVSSCIIEIVFGDGEYVYQYKIPSFYIQGNNFTDHTLYNHLRNSICSYVCHYDNSFTPKLEKIKTDWREATLKAYFEQNGDEIEGIYESTTPNTDGHTPKYKLALKRNKDNAYKYSYYLIYLSGANRYRDWDEGEIKALLFPTATPGLYKVDWRMLNKSWNRDYYITLDLGFFKSTNGTSSGEEMYLKLYPTISSRKPKQPEKWSGSGFALNDGYVVTNFHVADKANSILVYQDKGDGTRQAYRAILAASDKTNDIAILRINDPYFKGFGQIPYKIKSGICDVGESVWALGYPMTDIMGDEVKFTDGKISARSGIDGETSVYQISVPIQHGNSGGPLFDTKGNIVGITSSGLNREKLHTENVNYAIKISYLRLLVENSLPTSLFPQGTALQGQTLTTQIKLAKKFVFFIECSTEDGVQSITSSTSQSIPVSPSAPIAPSKPAQSSPSLTPKEAMTILHGSNEIEKKNAFGALHSLAQNGNA